MSRGTRFLKACRREPVDATPVWLMRQAGRYMAEYRELRAQHSLLEMIKTPDLATEVTLQPIRAFDLDAAIIFADILPLLECLGLELEFVSGTGPVIGNPLSGPGDIDRLSLRSPVETLSFTLDAVRQTRMELDGVVPLIGFSGAPFTLACYAIEGGSSKEFLKAREFMYAHANSWHKLMDMLARATGEYLTAQADAGAQALQLFDSWAGLLSPDDYREYVQPYSKAIIETVHGHTDVPVIHFGTGTGGLLDLFKDAGADVIGVDWRMDLDRAWALIGHDVAIQGNLDPVLLFASEDTIKQRAREILGRVSGKPGHIFNLGHGVLKQTSVDKVSMLVDFVHEETEVAPEK